QLRQRIQVVAVGDLRIVVGYQKIVAVEGNGHLGGSISSPQGGDQGVASRVVHQYLIGILTKQIEPVASRIRQRIHQFTRRIEERAAILGFAIIDQYAEAAAHVGFVIRLWNSSRGRPRHVHRGRGEDFELVGLGPNQTAKRRGIDRNLDRDRRSSGRRR